MLNLNIDIQPKLVDRHLHTATVKDGNENRKVAFGYGTLVFDIKVSGGVPTGLKNLFGDSLSRTISLSTDLVVLVPNKPQFGDFPRERVVQRGKEEWKAQLFPFLKDGREPKLWDATKSTWVNDPKFEQWFVLPKELNK